VPRTRSRGQGCTVRHLEPGVDGEELGSFGAEEANRRAVARRLARLGLGRAGFASPVKVGEWWVSRDKQHCGRGRPFEIVAIGWDRIVVRHEDGTASALSPRTFKGYRRRYSRTTPPR
jgi:hypothetical protein